jgi:ABC-type sugar transport system ATPase subunit
LSGGNQQKAIFARWLEHDLALLLLDEPTRGVDVRAREELHEVIRDLAYSGTNVIIASNDLKELMRSCDRIITIVQGKTSKEFWRESWDEAEITAATLSIA